MERNRTTQQGADERPLVCDLTAIDAGDRPAHEDNARALFEQVEQVVETDRGYAFRLPADSDLIERAAKFVALERLCCPFFDLSIRTGPGRTVTWLELSGTTQVKQYIRDNVVQRLNAEQGVDSC